MDSNIEYLSLKEINTNINSKLRENLFALHKDSKDGWLYNSLKWLEFIDCYERTLSSGFLIKYDRNKNIEGFISFSIFYNQFKKSISLLENGIGWPILAVSADLSVEDKLLIALKEIGFKEECERIMINIRDPLVSQKDLINRQLKVTKLGYKSIIQTNHYIKMDNWQTKIRKRYKRYIRKYIKLFNISIIDSKNIINLEEIAKEYMELHIMDAGRKTRNLESYIKQVEFIKEDEGFFVKAENNESGITEGMLLITLIKGHALDNSVATTDYGKNNYVSHILKKIAMEFLEKKMTKSYFLGEDFTLSTNELIPSAKQLGISYFKDGWCGGERFYSINSILNLRS